MPVYEYTCKDCGHHFDTLRSMKDADVTIACKKCHSEHTYRMLSRFFSQSDNRASSSQGTGCSGCSGSNCSSCRH